MFFRMDKVERAGTGIRRMKEAMSAAGLPAPGIRQSGFYTIIFKRPVSEGLGEKVGEKPVKRSEKKLGEKLGENEMKILEIIIQNKFVTIPELSRLLKISTTSIENNLSKLKKKEALKRIGPDKGGYWQIVSDKQGRDNE